MTPKKKTANSTTLLMERKSIIPQGDMHIAGGDNAGIVVNKQQLHESGKFRSKMFFSHKIFFKYLTLTEGTDEPAHLSLEFRVFLINVATKRYTQERRVLSYWFKNHVDENIRVFSSQEFFKKLVSPKDFPRGKKTL